MRNGPGPHLPLPYSYSGFYHFTSFNLHLLIKTHSYIHLNSIAHSLHATYTYRQIKLNGIYTCTLGAIELKTHLDPYISAGKCRKLNYKYLQILLVWLLGQNTQMLSFSYNFHCSIFFSRLRVHQAMVNYIMFLN